MDPKHLCPAIPSEEYTAPEDVLFEQVWDPQVLVPCERLGRNPLDPNELVQEFAGSVSHDKVGICTSWCVYSRKRKETGDGELSKCLCRAICVQADYPANHVVSVVSNVILDCDTLSTVTVEVAAAVVVVDV